MEAKANKVSVVLGEPIKPLNTPDLSNCKYPFVEESEPLAPVVRFAEILPKKNNPAVCPFDEDLFLFPQRDGRFTSFAMDPDVPYIEYHVGVHNVFKILRIEYFRRLTYLNLPDVNKHGVRMSLQFKF